ncbi:LacI family DNA-binding transcriptional regulator [Ketogulonicigenium vulgare]|uniref:LacI family DNA-binding transcriptional regulator n=1 Tax=Ketogulonicigenium vulgare TaxID=92945 RepID=UPI0023586014|nr:substrate-binding domain-containing protein [Ketogulonicigenium vulgare]
MSYRSRITALDVAQLAGVSRSAVSRTFTEGASVSPQVRARVLAAAETLGYRVNLLAKGLKDQRTSIVGLVVSDMHHSLRAQLVDALARQLMQAGYRPMLLPVEGEDGMAHALHMMLDYNVAGAILTSDAPPASIAAECARHHLPLVVLNRDSAGATYAAIRHDAEAAGALAAETLARAGCKRVIAVRQSRPSFTITWRARAFAARASALGLDVDELIAGTRHDYDGGCAAGLAFLPTAARFDGVHCGNDFSALGFLDALRGHISVPGDLAVIGCDDIAEGAWRAYNLTTIRHSMRDLASAAVATLTAQLTGAPPQRQQILPVSLVPRGTTPPL